MLSFFGFCIYILISTVPLTVHGVRVPVLSDQWRRHVHKICCDRAEWHTGVDLQPSLPLHLHLYLHLHGPVALHCTHHWSLRHFSIMVLLLCLLLDSLVSAHFKSVLADNQIDVGRGKSNEFHIIKLL